MRLIVTGRTRSGKSVALDRIVRTALQGTWSHALIIDGKTGRVTRSASDGSMLLMESVASKDVVQMLTDAADRITVRCAALPAGESPPLASQRELLIIDEVQTYTRGNGAVGTAARSAILSLFEKSAVLGDVIVIASQRTSGAVPPGARVNASADLRMLGAGFFQLAAPGLAPRQGRVDPAAPLASVATLTTERLLDALCAAAEPRPHPTLITRYEGVPGSGRTYALAHHAGATPGMRRVSLDITEYSHKGLLIACLEQCGAVPPENARVSLTELSEAASIALRAEPTLLLIDNCHAVSVRAVDTIQRMLDAATEAAIALTPPPHNLTKDLAAPIRRRAALVELRPLDAAHSEALARHVAPALDAASAQAVVQRSGGSPQAVVAFAERVAAHGADERYRLEAARPPSRWLNLLLMFVALVVVLFIQRSVAHDLAGAVLTAVFFIMMWFIRPRINAAMRP